MMLLLQGKQPQEALPPERWWWWLVVFTLRAFSVARFSCCRCWACAVERHSSARLCTLVILLISFSSRSHLTTRHNQGEWMRNGGKEFQTLSLTSASVFGAAYKASALASASSELLTDDLLSSSPPPR